MQSKLTIQEKHQRVIDLALAGRKVPYISSAEALGQQQVRKILRRERDRRRDAGEDVPPTLFAGRVKVESTKRAVDHTALRHAFQICAIMRVEPNYAQLADDHQISVRSVRREHKAWREGDRAVQDFAFSADEADAIARLGPDRVEVPQPERDIVPRVYAPTGLGFEGYVPVIGYAEVRDDGARSPYDKQVLLFIGLLFTIMGALLYAFTPGA